MRKLGNPPNYIDISKPKEIICTSNEQYWDILLDFQRPGIADMYRNILSDKIPSITLIKSLNPPCTAFIQHKVPKVLSRYKDQLFSVFIAPNIAQLVSFFDDLQYKEINPRKKDYYYSYYRQTRTFYTNLMI